MEDEKKNEEQEKGFIIKDRRFTAKKEENLQHKEEAKREEGPEEEVPDKEGPLPEITFNSFVFSLSTSALIQLGEIKDPVTKQISKNFVLAKHTIDLIAMLKEKTKGNLTIDEERLIETILYDLRMRYVKAAP